MTDKMEEALRRIAALGSREPVQSIDPESADARWTVRGIDRSIREIANAGAERKGVTVGEWLSEAVTVFDFAIQIARDALPRPLEVGDMVKNRNGTGGEIRAIDGDLAWVRFHGAPENMTVQILNLERI